MTQLLARLALAACFACVGTGTSLACGVMDGSGPRGWVDQADVIVRARAVEQSGPPGRTSIRFELLETLKGTAPATLEFRGEIEDWVDSNDPWVPRTYVRHGGRRGNCYATNYQRGVEYLLMLQRQDGTLTPYWAEMATTNEHVTGARDPWVRWVREYLDLRAQGPALDGTLPAACDSDMDLFPDRPCHFALGREGFSLDGHGVLKRLHGPPLEARLPVPAGMSLERVAVAALPDFALIAYELIDAHSGRGEVVRLNRKTLEVDWRLALPSFNTSPAVIEGNRMYIATIGALAAIDLDRGTFAWKHEGLYDQRTFAFNAFERPVVRPTGIVFRESVDGPRAPMTIVVDKAMGRIRRR